MLKVAICDDSSMYSEKIETFVTRFGAANLVEVKTEVFTSGSQLMLYFGEKKFDLIFLDISMPGLDGLETASIISVKSLCFSSIVISTDALAYIILGHEEKNTMTFLSD